LVETQTAITVRHCTNKDEKDLVFGPRRPSYYGRVGHLLAS